MSDDPGNQQVLYSFNGKKYTSFADCLAAAEASKKRSKAEYWKRLTVVEVEGSDGVKVVKVRCCFCLDDYCTSNISQFGGSHFLDDFTTCVRSAGKSSSIPKRTAAAAGADSQSSAKRDKQDITTFFVPRRVATEAVDHLARFFFSNATVALHLIEDPCLKASYASMGVELPSRTALSTTILDRVFVEVQQQVVVIGMIEEAD
jgi:hypothetical protein